MCDDSVCVCVCFSGKWERERGRANDCWSGARSLGTRVIDSFCHTDRLWIICRHLTSWKANSGVLNFSTLALVRRKLDFCVCTCKIPPPPPPAKHKSVFRESFFVQLRLQIWGMCSLINWCDIVSLFLCVLFFLHADGFLLSLQLQTLPFLRKTRVRKVKNKLVKQSDKSFWQYFHASKSLYERDLQALNHFIQQRRSTKKHPQVESKS